MKKQLLLLACALLSGMLFSQAVPMALEEWRTTAGTQNLFYKNVTKTDASGNIFVAGATMDGFGTDILVAKYNSAGVQLWIQQFQGTAPGGIDFAGGMVVTNTYVYLTGAISNNTVTPETDMVTMQLASSTGSVVWSTTYSGAGGLHDAGKAIYADGSGNVFVSGGSYNASLNTDYVVLHYNSSGVQQWVTTYDYAGFDDASSGIQNSGSNINIGGAVTTATPGVYRSAILSLAKATGSILATTTSTAVTTTSVDVVTDFATSGTDLILIGSSTVGGQGTNMYVQKFNNTLLSSWTYTYNGASSLDDVAKGVQADASGNVYVAGFSTSSTLGRELTLIKLNSSGVQQWVQTSGLSGDDEAHDLIIDAANDVYLTGYKTSAAGDKNYYTVKYDASGTKIWEVEMDGNLNDYATNLTLDSLNNVIVTGQTEITSGTFNFTTIKYSQREVLVPIDFNNESANEDFQYYKNVGQVTTYSGTIVPSVQYYTNSHNPKIYLNSTSNYFVYTKGDTLLSTADSIVRMTLNFLNADSLAKAYKYEETEGYVNYFLNNLLKPIVGLKGNNRILVPSLYPNIDLQIYNNSNGIKYYFILKPGATLSDINFNFSGANTTTLVSNNIAVDCHLKHLTFSRPKVYQIDGTPTIINSGNGSWRKVGTDTYGILSSVTTNTAYSIIIMVETDKVTPVTVVGNIEWSTFFGVGSVQDIRVNKNNGKQYLIGSTGDANFPVINGLDVTPPYATLPDVFIAQFKSNNSRDWVTYYGGTTNINDYYENADFGTGIDYDAQGNVYCIGFTWSDTIPTKASTSPSSYFQSKNSVTSGYGSDIFVLKLDSSGGLYSQNPIWCTFLGGASNEESVKIRMAGNDFYMTGKGGTGIGSNPTPLHFKAGAYNQDSTGQTQIFKFSKDLIYNWGTNFGNPGKSNLINACDWSVGSGLTITGIASALSLPATTAGANIPFNGGTGDAYWAIFDANDTIKYCTYIGGGSYDEGYDVLNDNNGFSYIVGTTSSHATQFPYKFTAGNYIDSVYNGSQDGFISCFRNSTGDLVYSTYYGGSNNEVIYGICSDQSASIYIHGTTSSSNLYIPSGSPGGLYSQSSSGPADETFVGRLLRTSNDFDWITYFGGTSTDNAVKISSYKNKSLYITGTGNVASNTFPTNPGIAGSSYFSTNGNIYVSRFDLTPFYVGINEQVKTNANDLFAFPNPTDGMVYVKGNTIFSKLEVYNIMGQKLLEHKDANSINIESLATGVYILRICSKENYKSVKIIRE